MAIVGGVSGGIINLVSLPSGRLSLHCDAFVVETKVHTGSLPYRTLRVLIS